MNFGSMQQTDQFLLRILFSSAATVGLIGWNEAFRRWLWRTGRFLVALAISICTIGSTPLLADEISSKTSISPDTVVLLLSQTAHSTGSNALADKVIKWGRSNLKIAFLSMDSTARVEKAFNNYIDRLNIAKVGITYTIVSDVNHADVIVFHDQRSSEILSKHKFTIDDLMSGQEFQVNHEVAKTITQVVRNDTAGCLGFDTTLESFERLKSIVFVSSAGDDQRVSQCLSSLLLASLGLTSKDTPGETVESLQSPFLVPTENDLIALKLLYGKSIGPGDTIEQVLASQDLVKFLPH